MVSLRYSIFDLTLLDFDIQFDIFLYLTFTRILDQVNFKAQFSQLPQLKPELIPTPGTPKELPTTPDVVLQSYRKKRKNSTGKKYGAQISSTSPYPVFQLVSERIILPQARNLAVLICISG